MIRGKNTHGKVEKLYFGISVQKTNATNLKHGTDYHIFIIIFSILADKWKLVSNYNVSHVSTVTWEYMLYVMFVVWLAGCYPY